MQLRRILQEAGTQVPDFSTIKTVPPPISALGSLTGAADTVPYFTSPTVMAVTALTAYIRTLLAAATATAARATLDITSHQSNVVKTTGALAQFATETGTITIPDKECDLVGLVVDRACWVTLYATSAARASDSTRLLPTRPTAGTGVLAEFVLPVSFTFPYTVAVGPVPRLQNGDGTGGAPSANTVYYRIQNLDPVTHTVQATFYFGALP